MPTYTTFNITTGNPDGTISFTPSGSAYAPTSSNAATAAQVDIIVSSHTLTNIISNDNLNPYLQIPLISGSNFPTGINFDLLIRFYSESHIQEPYISTVASQNSITGYLKEENQNLYLTSSLTDNFTFRDISYVTNDSGSLLRDKIFDVITGSAIYFPQTLISASKNESSAGGINYYSCSIHYDNLKGQIHFPLIYTGSFSKLSGSLMVSSSNTGSGLLNFVEDLIMPSVSSSFNIGFDPLDGKSMLFSVSTSSLSYVGTGRLSSTLMYFSSSGHVGIGTKTPKTDLEVTGSIQADRIITKAKKGRPIVISDSEIKFYETTQTDPEHGDYQENKEKARIKAVPGSFNLVFEVSGSSGYTNSVYISQSGKIGFNTDDPQTGFDAVVEEAQFQQPGSRKGLKINNEGNIESFNKDIDSATTGSEFILRYSRGTTINAESMNALFGEGNFGDDGSAVDYFNSLRSEEQSSILEKLESLGFNTLPNVGDTIGSIRFIAESGSVAGFSDRITGEAASIRALVSDIDETGVKGDLIFSVASKEGASEQKLLLDANNNHELIGSLDITSNLTIGTGIFHKGDTDTSLNFTDDTITFKVGDEILMQIIEHTQDQVLIGDGGDVDFRVVSNGQGVSGPNPSLFVEGLSGNVGIGINTPTSKLHVVGDALITGKITAQEFHTEFVSASIIYQSGSTKFGDTSDDVHSFSGSLRVTGSGDHYFTAGNVGIGTTSPVSNLHVFEGSSGESFTNLYGLAVETSGTSNSYHAMQVATGVGTVFDITNAGNVGIGTTSPISTLDVNGTISLSGSAENKLYNASTSPANGTSTNTTVLYGRQIDLYALDDIVLRTGTSPSDDIIFFAGNSERARILGSGNVGIGTTSPTAKLHVAGNIWASGSSGHITASGNISASGDLIVQNITASNNINAGGTGSFGMVGIGKTNPAYSLDCLGNFNINGTNQVNLRCNNANVFNGYTTQTMINSYGLDRPIVFTLNQGITEAMRIAGTTGNVGIGTTTPTAKLHVAGNIWASGSNGHITASGNISASGHILALEFIGGQGNSDVDTGTETVATATGATAAFFDYVAKNGTNLRAGTVTSVTDGTNVEFNEVSTVDLGDTTDVKFSVVLSSGNLLFKATVLSNNWDIKALVRKL
jgi:hypothetical protein